MWEARCYDSCGRNACNTRPGCVWGRPRAECRVDRPARLRQPAWTQAPKRALAAATGNEKTPPPWISGRVPNGSNSLMAGESDGGKHLSDSRASPHSIGVNLRIFADWHRLVSGPTSTRRDLFPAHFERNFDSPNTFGVVLRHTLTHCDVACSMKHQSGHLNFCSDL